VYIVPAKCVSQLASSFVGVAECDNVPIKAFFPEQEVAQRATDEVWPLLLFAKVASCVL